MKVIMLLSLLTSPALAKTYFVDPLANLVFYDVSTDRTPNLFEKNPYNSILIKTLKQEKNIFIFNEFSGLGDLNLKALPKAKYLKPPKYFFEPLILKFNEWGFTKTDDFFLSVDSMLFSVLTWHPFSKRSQITNTLKNINKEEEIIVYTTTWTSGEALYKSLLKEYSNVSYRVRDIKLNKTLFYNDEAYPFVKSEENTRYIIYDSADCEEIFNLKSQAGLVSSEYTFKKSRTYHQSNKRAGNLVAARIKNYQEEVCAKER